MGSSAGSSLSLELTSSVPLVVVQHSTDNAAETGRILTQDADQVKVTISDAAGSVYFSAFAPVDHSGANPRVALQAPDLPLGQALRVRVEVYSAGNLVLEANENLVPSKDKTEVQVKLVPSVGFPGLTEVAKGKPSKAVPAGRSAILIVKTPKPSSHTYVRWTLSDPSVTVKIYDEKGLSLETGFMEGNNYSADLAPRVSGTFYAVVSNNATPLTISDFDRVSWAVQRIDTSTVKYIFDEPGAYENIAPPFVNANLTVKAWGAGGAKGPHKDSAPGGFVYSTGIIMDSHKISVAVGHSGDTGQIQKQPAVAGNGTGGKRGGGGSVVAYRNDSTVPFTLLAVAGGGGVSGSSADTGLPGGFNGKSIEANVYAGACDNTNQAPGGYFGGRGYNVNNGGNWVPNSLTFTGLGGIGGNHSGFGSGGGGYGGGGGGGNGSTTYSSGGGGSYASGVGNYFTEGLNSGGHNSTLDSDYVTPTGLGGTSGLTSGGNGGVILVFTSSS